MNEDDRCPGTNRDGDQCGHPAGWGTESDTGPCKFHGGASTGPTDPSTMEGNGNAQTHGMTADESLLYERLTDDQQALVDGWERGLKSDAATAQGYADAEALPSYFDPILHRLAMNMLRMTIFAEDWQADADIDEDVDNPLVNRWFDGRTEGGDVILEYSETVVERAANRMSTENRQWLKDLGIIGSPEERAADQLSASLTTALASDE